MKWRSETLETAEASAERLRAMFRARTVGWVNKIRTGAIGGRL
jgi:hypothetical protein